MPTTYSSAFSFQSQRTAENNKRERQTGLEPATLGLGSQCSTN